MPPLAYVVGLCLCRRERHLAEIDDRVADLRSDGEGPLAYLDDPHSASAIAFPSSSVLALPPMSRVRGPSERTRSMARTMASPASLCPRCSSIIAPDQIWPMGLAIPCPAMSGAEPCTGSNMDGNSRSG